MAQTLGINKMADNTTSETTGSKVGLILHILAHFLTTLLCLRKLSFYAQPYATYSKTNISETLTIAHQCKQSFWV